jgi:hypothetical protein
MARTMIGSSLLCAVVVALAAAAPPARGQVGGREFVGTVGNLKIRMKLVSTPAEFIGSYLYERVGEDIRLGGAANSDRTFYLNEYDVNGKATARFEGRFVTDDWIEGTWASATAGKKELPFSAWAPGGRGVPADAADDKLSGEYRRVYQGRFDKDAASLSVWLLKDGRVRVSGDSTWVGNAKTGNVNVGGADGIAGRQGGKWVFKSGDGEDDCRFTMAFGAGTLTVTDDNARCGGLNVSFDGTYRKTSPPKPRNRA